MGPLKSIARRARPILVPAGETGSLEGRLRPSGANAAGFVLADMEFQLVAANEVALRVLSYPRDLRSVGGTPFVQQRLRSMFGVDRVTAGIDSARFLSGGRRYVCRPFLLESDERPPMAAFLLERRSRDLLNLGEFGQRFHLSKRECETVQHLVLGLTTKEVADRMGVSPNTVKHFVRLVMSKMGVTTRSGIVGKLIDQ